ncbi:hypothetical protein BOTNAR_0066g00360 [Botryotinia narcissicola]|uniref:DUF6590 domain-containing protein n=1 Tax=Botryotinia narcissicola TaxID=278944 RepID=A0A4Z1IXX6_9HELO|nr:hypothetical protein BOTNAR_0066g00360 [Botryotinia narcissicola]
MLTTFHDATINKKFGLVLAVKGKKSDQSTPWSDWIWLEEQGYWYAHRTNSEGDEECEYRYPDKPENQAVTPRTSGLADIYTIPQTNDPNSFDHQATPKPFYAAPVPIHDDYGSPDSMVQNYGTASTDHSSSNWSSEYPSSGNATWQSNTDIVSPSIDVTARAFDAMSLATPHIPPAGAFDPEVSQAIVNAKHISKAPNTGNAEILDPKYTVYGGFRLQDDFWRVGRVFMMLWTEPAQPKVPVTGGTRNGSHFSTTILGQQAYSEIRSPIQTYSGQATLKPNLPAPERHTIIHTTPQAPGMHSRVASNGQLETENLILDPIQVDSERAHESEGLLNSLSRLNYSKVYTVEHYVRVLNIGMVSSNSIGVFLYQSGWSPGIQTVESQRPRSNVQHRRTSGHSSNNRRNRRTHNHN